jgi:thiol:disulfide interchange protein DsbC
MRVIIMIKKLLWITVLVMGFNGAVIAADDVTVINQVLAKLIPGSTPDSIGESVIPGLYQVSYGPEVIYITKDGRYVLQGDLLATDTRKNLTESIRSKARLKLINAVDPKSMIVFAPKEVKHTVTVFTDMDCGYCRKLHSQIADYNRYGIAIRYLAFPRSGVDTESYYKAVSVWCSPDRRTALTEAKLGEKLKRMNCDNPVREHMALADKLGVSATPTLILEDGSLISCYIPPKQMSQMLDKVAAAKP